MKGLLAVHVKSSAGSIGFSMCVIGIGLSLALSACQPSGHAQEARTTLLSGAHKVVTADLPCSPGWRDRKAVPIKITDSLIVSVPVKYIRYELLTCGKATKGIPRDGPPGWTSVSFDFFLPDFGGFTAKTLRNPFAPNEVRVGYVVAAGRLGFHPSDPAELESTQAKKELRVLADTSKYRDVYGLRCYQAKILKNREYCNSAHAAKNHEGIFFQVDLPFYKGKVPNPLMRATYYSKRYGGVEIDWWTSIKNMPHWREIDAQIWKFLAAWNVAQTAKNTGR